MKKVLTLISTILIAAAFSVASADISNKTSKPRTRPWNNFDSSRSGEIAFIIDEPFACLSMGSVEDPVFIDTDADSNIPVDLIGEDMYGFGGNALYQAGGQLLVAFEHIDSDGFVYYGDLWSPDLPDGFDYEVSIDVKCIDEGAEDEFNVAMSDYNTAFFDETYPISDQWQTISFKAQCSSETEHGCVYIWAAQCFEYDILVKNFKITAFEKDSSSLSAMTSDDNAAYFNLQGMKISMPTRGTLSIKVQNGEATKIR